MNPVGEIRKELFRKKARPSNGTVVASANGKITVRTSRGALLTVSAGAEEYRQGDRVRLNNDIIVERISSAAGKTVYVV